MKRIVQRFFKVLILLAAAGIIALVTVYLFREVLIAPRIQRLLESSIESRLGMEVAIGSISGTYITSFEVDNVTTLKPAPAGVLVSLKLRRLKVSYNPLFILKGLNSFTANAAVELEGVDLEFDLSREDVGPPVAAETGSTQALFLPELLPRIRVGETSVTLRGSDYETRFKGISLETRPRRQMTSILRLRVQEWSWVHPAFQAGKTPVSAELEYTPDTVTVRRLMLGGTELAEFVQVGLKSLPETMPFQAKVQLAGGRLALNGKLAASDLSARIKADHLDLAQISSFFQPRLELEGTVSMQADTTLPLAKPADLVAELNLELKQGNIYGIAADELNLQGSAKDGRLRLSKLDFKTSRNSIEFRDVGAAAPAVFAGDVEGILHSLAGGFSFDCRNVPAFFSMAGVDLTSEVATVPAHRLLLDGKIDNGYVLISDGSLTAENGHIRLDPSRIALPSLNRPIQDTAIRAAFDIDLPNLTPIGRLFRLPELSGAVQGHAKVTGTIGSPEGTADITARAIEFKGITYGDLTVKAAADSRTAVIEALTLQRGKDRLTGRGSFHFAAKKFEDVHLEFHLTDPAFYIAEFWPESLMPSHGKPHVGGSLNGKIAMEGPLTSPAGTADITLRNITFADNRFGDADIRLHSTGQKITVETFDIRQAKDRLDLKGSFDLTQRILQNVRMDIAIADSAAYTNNLLPARQTVAAAVRATVEASGPLGEPTARADIALDDVQLNGLSLDSAVFKLHSSGRHIHIGTARLNAPAAEVKLSGDLLRGPADKVFDMEITDLTFSVQQALLALQKPGHIHFTRSGAFSLRNISLGGSNGEIRLNGSLTAQKKADFDIGISDFNSGGWLESLVTDRFRFSGLNARIQLAGVVDAPSVAVSGDLANLEAAKDRFPLSGRFDFSYAGDKIIIRQFQWQDGPGQQIALTGTIPVNLFEKPLMRPGPLSVDAQVSISDLAVFGWLMPDYIPTDGSFQGKLEVAGTWKAPRGTFAFKSRGLNDPPHLKSMPPGPIDVNGSIRLDGRKAVVESIEIDSPELTFTSRGNWIGMPALSELLQGKAGKPAGSIDVRGNLRAEDLSWLAAENDSLRRVAGRLEANVTMKGPISDPAIDAVVHVINGELRPEMDVPSLQALNLNAAVTPAGLRLQEFTGQLGGAAFHVTGAVTRGGQNGIVADLRLQGQNLLFYRSAGLKVRADTDITVKGPVAHLKVAGDVAITDGRLVKYFDILGLLKGSSKPKADLGLQLFSIRQPPLRDMVFDVRVTSKNPFTIHNNLARGAVRPELRLTGTGEFPVLAGKVYVDSTRISLPSGSLVFDSGVIRFDPNRPDRPTLDLVGTSKMLGYDVTVVVEGPYDEPVVTLSSVPPLSNEQLLLLLLTGQQPNAAEGGQASQQQSLNVAVFLGRDLLARWFGSESSEATESIIDRFDITVGRAVTQSGEETIEAQFRIADNVLRNGDKLYITGEKDKYDFYNAGLKIVFQFK